MTYDPAENARKSYDVAIDAMREKLASFRCERIHDATLYLGDCREVMASWPSCFRVHACVTDPPYGVEFTGKVTKHTNKSGGLGYEDTEEYFRRVVLPAVSSAISRAERAAIFSGTRRLSEYPVSREIGGIVCPNGGGMSSWGFSCLHPILLYGTSPYLAAGLGSRPTASVMYHPGMHVTGEADNEHPCPKPIAFMEWALNVASLEGQTILDPFMGSGTTGVACAKLGRKFIGIELESKYFDIAVKRIDDAYRQPRLFKDEPPKPKQEALL